MQTRNCGPSTVLAWSYFGPSRRNRLTPQLFNTLIPFGPSGPSIFLKRPVKYKKHYIYSRERNGMVLGPLGPLHLPHPPITCHCHMDRALKMDQMYDAISPRTTDQISREQAAISGMCERSELCSVQTKGGYWPGINQRGLRTGT